MSSEDFTRWFKKAKRGEGFIYHRGFLLVDRTYDPQVDSYANIVWQAYQKGVVELVQRRVRDGCMYIAIRRRKS